MDDYYSRMVLHLSVEPLGEISASLSSDEQLWRGTRSGMPSTENWVDGGNGLTVIVVSFLTEMGHDSSYLTLSSRGMPLSQSSG